MILLHCVGSHGQVAMHATRIHGVEVPPRVYHIQEHFLAVDADHKSIIDHDAAELCQHQGIRLATPAEQDAYYAQKTHTTRIVEQVQAVDAPAVDETILGVEEPDDSSEETSATRERKPRPPRKDK